MTAAAVDPDKPGKAVSASDATCLPGPLHDYLLRLGIHDAALRQAVARESLMHAQKMAGPASGAQLVLRAVEAVQNRMDRAIGRFLGLNPVRDAAKIAGVRAALLLCAKTEVSTDFLFDATDIDAGKQQLARVTACLPVATPPEAHQNMQAQPFEFLFFKSS